MHCTSPKKIWDKIQTTYEGYKKVKPVKLQTYRGQFEHLRMKDEEEITTYILPIDEFVNTIRGLGEEVDESLVAQKILSILPKRFNPKI